MNHRRLQLFFLCLAVLGMVGTASAESHRLVSGARICLGDLLESLPEAAAAVDLGPSPPPGGSRLFSHHRLNRILAEQGLSVRFTEPVRVERDVVVRERESLRLWFQPEIVKVLPAGVELLRLEPPARLRLTRSAEISNVRLARLPRQVGVVESSATIEFMDADGDVTRAVCTLGLRLSETQARPAVVSGAVLTLRIASAVTEVTAEAVAMSMGEVGDVLPFRVVKTNRVVRARVVSERFAEVLGS